MEERIFVKELMNHPGLSGISVAQCRVETGVTTQLHSLNIDEIYIIREGVGWMEKNRSPPYEVKAGDCIYIESGTPQRITNSGASDLVFDTICQPRFTPENYTSLEPQ